MLGRVRGGVQVLERLGPENAENLYSPRVPAAMQGNTDHVLSLYGGKEALHSLLLRRSSKQGWGCWAAGLGVLGRGRGGVQVLEHLGPESAEHLYSPARPQQCRGIQIMCCLCMVGRKPTFVASSEKQHSRVRGAGQQGWGCWAGDAGECRFWNIWGLKVLNTCTPPHAPGNAGEYRSCAVSVWWEGTLHSLLLRRSKVGGAGQQGWGCWAGDAGEYRVLEHLGPESAEHLYSPARPRQCRGIQTMCCLCMVGRKPTFVASSEKQQAGLGVLGSRVGGAGPGTRGSTGFGTFGA